MAKAWARIVHRILLGFPGLNRAGSRKHEHPDIYMGDSVSFIFEKRNKLDYGMERRQDLEQMKNYRKRTKI